MKFVNCLGLLPVGINSLLTTSRYARPAFVQFGVTLLAVLTLSAAVSATDYSLASSTAPAATAMRGETWQDGQQFIDNMQKSAERQRQYEFHYRMLVFKPRSKKATEETGVVAFMSPRLMRSEVLSGPRRGALAVMGADGKIRGHLGGMLKMFSGTIASDSQWAKLLNGYPMAESDFASLAGCLKSMLKTGNLSRITKEPVTSRYVPQKTYILEIYQKHPQSELLIKRVFVDPQTNLPVVWEDYTTGKMSALTSWSQVKLDADLGEQKFKI